MTTTRTREELAAFVALVRAACAASPPAGRTGGRTWVHAAWATGRWAYQGVTLETFKRTLLEACQARLIDLSRCDMVEGYDLHDVRRSTITSNGATFNFIRD